MLCLNISHILKNLGTQFWFFWLNDFEFEFMLLKIMRRAQVTVPTFHSQTGKWLYGIEQASRVEPGRVDLSRSVWKYSAVYTFPFSALSTQHNLLIYYVIGRSNPFECLVRSAITKWIPNQSILSAFSRLPLLLSLLFHISMHLFGNYQNDSSDSWDGPMSA